MKKYLVVKNPGRLGNRMSEYATMFTLNKLYNVTSAMSTHHRHVCQSPHPLLLRCPLFVAKNLIVTHYLYENSKMPI